MDMAKLKPDQIATLLNAVNQKFPGWQGFADTRFMQDEVAYKQKAVEKAKSLLGESDLRQLIAQSKYDEFLSRLSKVGQSGGNLLWLAVPKDGDLSILHQENLDKPAFCQAFVDLIYGSASSAERLERYTAWLQANQLKNKWSFPTFFLWVCHPGSEMYVKYETTKWFLRYSGMLDNLPYIPSSEIYAGLLDLCRQLWEELQPYQPRDYVDIQSFIWVAFSTNQAKIKLAKPFNNIFRDGLEAQWAFNLLKTAADFLNLQGPGSPLVALTLRNISNGQMMRFNYGMWLVLGINGKNKTITNLQLALLKNRVKFLGPFQGGFRQSPGEPPVGIYNLTLEEFKANETEIMNVFAETMQYVSARFSTWAGAPHHQHNIAQLEAAVFDPDQREKLLTDGIQVTSGEDDPIPEDLVRYWKIAPGENAWNWEACRSGGYISLGWQEVGDVSAIQLQEFSNLCTTLLNDHPEWGPKGIEQVWTFAHIQVGDRIVANRGTREVLGIGTVIGPYTFVPNQEEHGHHLPVRWDDVQIRPIKKGHWVKTIIELTQAEFDEILAIQETPAPQPQPVYTLENCSEETGIDLIELRRWVQALDRKKQVILYGPPGTGKTFIAERLARHLVGGGDGFYKLVQFHPEVSYEDFVQGIRPRPLPGGGLDYPIVPGRFVEFCEKAGLNSNTCVLIIDEINRANLARVFGELMYLLEYRDKEVELAAGTIFKIPANVRIIGTMNTADRSIALVDHALRRRFAMLALNPNYTILRKFHQRESTGFVVDGLIDVLEELNEHIADRHYAIGPSYFLRKDISTQLSDIWQMEIEPYLEEYFFDPNSHYQRFCWQEVSTRILR